MVEGNHLSILIDLDLEHTIEIETSNKENNKKIRTD